MRLILKHRRRDSRLQRACCLFNFKARRKAKRVHRTHGNARTKYFAHKHCEMKYRHKRTRVAQPLRYTGPTHMDASLHTTAPSFFVHGLLLRRWSIPQMLTQRKWSAPKRLADSKSARRHVWREHDIINEAFPKLCHMTSLRAMTAHRMSAVTRHARCLTRLVCRPARACGVPAHA